MLITKELANIVGYSKAFGKCSPGCPWTQCFRQNGRETLRKRF